MSKIENQIGEMEFSDCSYLLFNLGFSPLFMKEISNTQKTILSPRIAPIKKVYSESTIDSYSPICKSKNIYRELYKEVESEIIDNQNENDKTDNDINIKMDSYDKSKEEKKVIKAYKSKHKKKYLNIYKKNSFIHKQNNKYRLFHKCSCGRTFSTSGWLRLHFDEHLKEVINNNNFSKLFKKYIQNINFE